ncbi:YidB family protein [Mannheimia massilioguelmaensis]|uniref:YidB family protein n=1 Tax=Mannheimia massilioguelmaensis TaxID=1604354 RepID=UPI0005CAD4D4|nr:YidB family protein [Mannheimia massilioguelmaensis]
MLEKIIGAVISNALGGNSNNGQNSSLITNVLGSLLQSQGGMEGIFNQLQKGGLGDVLESWIGTERNQPMHSNQVSEVFGEDTISHVAKQAGVDKSQAQDILSQVLPQIIDMLTPNGREGGVQTDSLAQATQRAQQEDGFGLDDLLGGVLGSVLGGGMSQQPQQPQQQMQQATEGGLGDLLNQVLNQQTRTSQTRAPSSNSELAQDIGSILNGFFGNRS